ncbi:testis-expressed protein 2-like isoform X1 [Periophthalmus magnuspinnatus]|uniref:testis-expressed protein 2-like isoform X1 n=1 Tax=Periophthalmus magnuspinnatus TaxID=409849 RepID=UPI00145BFB3F|nr:testis-expressed protein 2-like isoform X1 [Periophthalmus magnuspinnatus]
MTSQPPSHAESAQSTTRPLLTVAPKFQLPRPPSRETVTIHFSAQRKDEEEEDGEITMTNTSTTSAPQDDSSIVTGLEASEEMFEDAFQEFSTGSHVSPETTGCSAESKLTTPAASHTEKNTTSPSKSLSFPSSDKPFLSLVKSLSSDIESKDGSASSSSSIRHRHLKNLVKSFSSDTSSQDQPSSSTSRLPESRLNLQLFRQFTQSRLPSASLSTVGDSKTAPTSPMTSPENRSFFKVAEVEARIEDTKRRFSEAIAEPLQLLTKMIDEKSGSKGTGGIYRPKVISTSASELSNLSSLNGQLESNNNYCIKEESGELEADNPNSEPTILAESPVSSSRDTKSPTKTSYLSMSTLAKQEDEEFCILTNEDFETCTDTEGDGGDQTEETQVPQSGSTEPGSDDESEYFEPAQNVPYYTLIFLTLLVYGYFILPWPTYVGGMLLGTGLGFLLAIGVVWLTGPKSSSGYRYFKVRKLDIKQPEIYKGWMNEISNYDPETYHATLTHSVYVRLEGSTIRLSKPNHNISRRAAHNDLKPDVTFVSQKIYDLAYSKIHLVPEGLARKRIWNKKYPICIELGKQDDFMSRTQGDKWESIEGSLTKDKTDGTVSTGNATLSQSVTLYLFGRTGREKEDWFQRFLEASKHKVDMKKSASATVLKIGGGHSRSGSRSSLDEALLTQSRPKDGSTSTAGSAKPSPLLDYSLYMANLLPNQEAHSPPSVCSSLQSPMSSPGADKKLPCSSPSPPEQNTGDEEDPVAWLNAALGRIFWDFLREPYWADMVSKKIQMKLSKIRLPYFMNELTLTELDMGSSTPRILSGSKPYIDYKGLWFDLDVSYSGSFLMTLETKMNLIRLGKEEESLRFGEPGKDGYRPRTYCLADSDEESSSAGSSDEEDTSELSNDCTGAEGLVGGHRPSKIMRFVDKIAKSKYFQKATETEFIKKKMEEVSNTPLLLTVELQEVRGRLAVNIPPPPTDRIWYGFRTPPHLELKARPKLGERVVTLAHVTDWIEKKLDQEFQKIFVMPNMDDVWLTIMHSAMDQRTAGAGPVEDSETSDPASES